MIGDRNRTEELVQETFTRAFRNLSTLRPESRLSTWLFGIARNVVLESIKEGYCADRRVNLEEQAFQTLADERPQPEALLFSRELEQAIIRALASLSEERRIVFVLREFNKFSYQEISKITGSSVVKLKTDLHRARHQMRKMLKPYWGDRGAR